jgi:NTP pyrophosphatase (non-canonical NTP hydrolase)
MAPSETKHTRPITTAHAHINKSKTIRREEHNYLQMAATVNTIQALTRQLAMDIAILCSKITVPTKKREEQTITHLVYTTLWRLATMCFVMQFNPAEIIIKKMMINKSKYDEKECMKHAHILKWTAFSNVSGINESTVLPVIFSNSVVHSKEDAMKALMDSFIPIAADIHAFAKRRNWIDKYTEQSITMSLIAETGELAEVFQWRDSNQTIAQMQLNAVNDCAMEIADIYVYLFHLCRVLEMSKATLDEILLP